MSPVSPITPCALPPGALLARYADSGYTDCFVTTVPRTVTQASFVEAFYTTPLFKAERLVLAAVLARPSSDAQARAMAAGEGSAFGAWTVEDRSADQILLRDFLGSTRSWLMSASEAGATATRLYFGTAMVPRRDGRGLGAGFRALVPFHRLYARALLRSAVWRLESDRFARSATVSDAR